MSKTIDPVDVKGAVKNDIIKELEWYLHIFELRLNTIENNEKLLAHNRGYLLGIKNALEIIRNGVDCNE